MEISFILLIIGFLFLTYLIFKFIKKIVFAVISFIFLIILIIGSVFGLAILDLNNLANQNDFNINLIYGSSDSPNFALTIPIKNQSIDIKSVKNYDLIGLKNEKYKDDDKNFYVFFSKDLIKKILEDDKNYYLKGTENLNLAGYDVKTKLTKDEVLKLLNSNSAEDDYVNIIYEQNNFPKTLSSGIKPMIKKYLNDELKKVNLGFKQALFSSVFLDSLSDSNNIIILVEGFKNNNLKIYPERFTFKLIKILPISMIKDYIPTNLINDYTENNDNTGN